MPSSVTQIKMKGRDMLILQRFFDLTLRNNLIKTSFKLNYPKFLISDMIKWKRKRPKSISQYCTKCKQLNRVYSFFHLKSNGCGCPKSEQLFAAIHGLSETVQGLVDGRGRSQNLVFFKFVIESAAADSEATGSLAFVPITLFHDLQEETFFVFKKAAG